jgi:uncharacterized protein YjbI with pentapeptide repeats
MIDTDPPAAPDATPPASQDETLARALDDHERWARSDGRDGCRAELAEAVLARCDLAGRVLAGADLTAADLREARLAGADLADAVLDGADLRGADLGDARLGGARLEGANVAGARLVRADLRQARLQGVRGLALAELRDADLSGARGLAADDLAGTDLTGVRLPEALADFRRMAHLGETIGIARPIYLFVLLVTAFTVLTVFSTPDVALFTNASSAVMPNLSTAIPAASLFWIAPTVLVFLYAYHHFYMGRIWEDIAGLPDVFPDGSPIERRAHPWLFMGLVKLRHGAGAIGFREVLVVFLMWGAVPATLLAIWWRYLPVRDGLVTAAHIVAVLFGVWGAVALFERAVSRITRSRWRVPGARRALRVLATVMVLVSVTMHALPWLLDRFGRTDPGGGLLAHPEVTGVKPKNVRWLVADLEDGDLSNAVLTERDLRYAYAHRADFAETNLKDASIAGGDYQRADFSLALLEDTDLSDANLDSTGFRNACLRRARLLRADLEDADFTGAYLGRADLELAYLGRARLKLANLQGARLVDADLSGADLRGAVFGCYAFHQHDPEREREVVCADLSRANLAGANLAGAQFLGTDLTEARNLQPAQLQRACGVDAALPPNLRRYLPDCGKDANRGIAPAALADDSPVDPEENPCWHEMRSDFDPGPATDR